MVSYFIPRGRFLLKAGHLRQVNQKKQQENKWAILRQFRRGLSTPTPNVNKIASPTQKKIENLNTNNYCSSDISKSSADLQNAHNTNNQRKRWSKWTRFLRWAPLGIFFFGAIEWQLHKRKCEQNQLQRTASNFQSMMYRSLPLRLISRCWGWIASCYLPISFRPFILGWYSQTFNVNLDEALYSDYKHYQSLAEFFTRPLRDGVRVIDENAPLISPADGKVLHFGLASNSYIEQVKGVNYRIESFLGPPTWAGNSNKNTDSHYEELIKMKGDENTNLYQCVIYLAPGDYHRFHTPTQWQPTMRRHFSGELLSVSPKVAMWLPGLFCLNERAVYLGCWEYGFFSYTAVGATNVGSVKIYMDDNLKTNRWVGLNVGTHKNHNEYDETPLKGCAALKKGELFGQFNMGSTIVLLFEAPKNFRFKIHAGQLIKVGEPLGYLASE